MQDRFQFRVWKSKENRMVYGVTYLNPLILDPKIDPENAHNKLMQCTGLVDKNGKLIYEGDIVKVTCMHEKMGGLYYMLMQVIYEVKEHGNDAYSGFSLKHNEKGVFALWGSDKTEVIGNIYENPELLESN